MSKIKIGFEVSDNWDIQAFRDVIYSLINTPQEINPKLKAGDVELFIVSTHDSTFYIQKVGLVAGIPTDHVFNPGSTALKLTRIDTEQIQIFLDNLQNVVMQIDELSQYADGILVDYKQDTYHINPKWYQQLQEKINRLLDENC